VKQPKLKNWKKYSFDFLSIFIAVISAFTLNSWNDNRKDRIAESKILTEIHNGLEKDLEDLGLNVTGHNRGLKAIGYFRDILAQKEVAEDSVLYHYFNLTRDYISIQNKSGYETLKSRGLELVENDSLRAKIISLYEYDYNALQKLEEEYFELQFQENYFKEINQIISGNLVFNEEKSPTHINTPLKITDEEEKLLLTYLWKIQINRDFILRYYATVENKIKSVREEIEQELN